MPHWTEDFEMSQKFWVVKILNTWNVSYIILYYKMPEVDHDVEFKDSLVVDFRDNWVSALMHSGHKHN